MPPGPDGYPLVADTGSGRHVPEPSRPSPQLAPSPYFWRAAGKWTVGALFFLSMLALLVALPLFQVTSKGPAKQTLRRAVAALTEIDPLIDRDYADLQQRAGALPSGQTTQMRDFPIDVPLTRDEALGSSKQTLRDLLLDRSADIMYREGTEPLRATTGDRQHVGFFTIGGITDHGLGFLRSRNHDILAGVTFSLAALAAVLGVTLAALCRGFGRLAGVGGVVLLGAIPLAVAGIGARFYMRIVSTGDTEYIQKQFLEIGQAIAWIAIRDGLAFTVLGGVFLVTGVACARWNDRA